MALLNKRLFLISEWELGNRFVVKVRTGFLVTTNHTLHCWCNLSGIPKLWFRWYAVPSCSVCLLFRDVFILRHQNAQSAETGMVSSSQPYLANLYGCVERSDSLNVARLSRTGYKWWRTQFTLIHVSDERGAVSLLFLVYSSVCC